MYYLRTKPAASAIQFTVDKSKVVGKTETAEETKNEENEKEKNAAAMTCSLENKDECLMCGS